MRRTYWEDAVYITDWQNHNYNIDLLLVYGIEEQTCSRELSVWEKCICTGKKSNETDQTQLQRHAGDKTLDVYYMMADQCFFYSICTLLLFLIKPMLSFSIWFVLFQFCYCMSHTVGVFISVETSVLLLCRADIHQLNDGDNQSS